jgi:hypothetical protein
MTKVGVKTFLSLSKYGQLNSIVNFINILQVVFAPILLRQKNTKPKYITRERLRKALLYEKVARRMLMKLTPK